MIFSKEQIRALNDLDVSGKGGKDREIAEALGHQRVSSKYYDGVDAYGQTWEYKKQTSMQFLDPYKFSQMMEEEKQIPILFFNHVEGKIVSVHKATYKEVIKKMGYTKEGLSMLNTLFERPEYANRMIQPKAVLTKKEILSFEKVLELSENGDKNEN
jgi:hypothetical protein